MYATGPALSGTLVKEFGFQAMLVGVALICFAYCPFLLMLKDPPHRTEQEKAEQEVGVIQIQYKNLSTGFNRFLAVSYYDFSHTMIYFRTTILFRSYFLK